MGASSRRAALGRTGIRVGPLCFGTIPLGPSRGLSTAQAVSLLRRAYDLGINFIDTAEIYGNYEPIRLSLRGVPQPVVVATKSYAFDAAGMRASLEKARRELGRDRIDLFLLHEIESAANLRGHRGALEYLMEARSRGLVGAVGISTHSVAGVRAGYAEPEVDVIHPLINSRGLGIKDGGAEAMAEAVAVAGSLGRGVYAMKALAGGHLGPQAAEAIAYVRDLPGIVSLAVGIQSEEELLVDLAYCLGEKPLAAALAKVGGRTRRLFIEPWCTGCGRCVSSCPFNLLALKNGRLTVRADECVLCGYCASACENLCLKVV